MRLIRSCVSVVFFIAFALGGLLFSGLVLPFVRRREAAHACVRWLWQTILKGFEITRLAKVSINLPPEGIRGCVLVANHPSLVDVVVLTALIPRTYSVAKRSLRRNPCMGYIIRRTFLHDDVALFKEAPPLLAAGANILIFPEGTRSPDNRTVRAFHRGSAQLALRARVPVVPVILDYSCHVLGKHQAITDMGAKPVQIRVMVGSPQLPPETEPDRFHAVAARWTVSLRNTIVAALPPAQ